MLTTFLGISLGLFVGSLAVALKPHTWMVRVSLVVAITGVSGLLYLSLGDQQGYQRYVASRNNQINLEKAKELMQSPETVIANMEAHLQENPNSAKGWYLLGKLYRTTDNSERALSAFENAYKLEPNNLDIAMQFVLGLYWKNNQNRNQQINQIIQRMQDINDNDIALNQFLAIDYEKRKMNAKAMMHWEKILLQLPTDSTAHKQLMKHIANLN